MYFQTDGRESGDYLMKVLGEREYSLTTSGKCKIVREIKGKLTHRMSQKILRLK